MTTVPTSDETRNRILTEAERLFRHYGYSKTTVADIADACGMSSANVYRFFASKLQINEAICDRVIAQLESELRKVVHSDASASRRLTEFVGTIARHTLETLIEEKKVHDMVVVAMEEHWSAIERHIQVVRVMITEIITSGIATGEFRQQDPQSAARCVHSALITFCHPVVVAQCHDDTDTASPGEMAAFLLTALKA
jgi:AcrR family transcriptional regulator